MMIDRATEHLGRESEHSPTLTFVIAGKGEDPTSLLPALSGHVWATIAPNLCRESNSLIKDHELQG